MSIEIKTLPLGMLNTNAYLVGDTQTSEAILIDPVDEADEILAAAAEANWTIKQVIATHAHFDHVLASQSIVLETDAPFLIHEEAAPFLQNLPQTGLRFVGELFPEAAKPSRLLQDGDIIEQGRIRLQALYTPGHAPGHISLLLESEHTVFSGDALFRGAIGRTDLPGGSLEVLMNSIKTKLLPLEDNTTVFPGHGDSTTIGEENRNNPWITRHLS